MHFRSELVMLIYSAGSSEQFHCDSALTLLIMMLLLYLDWWCSAPSAAVHLHSPPPQKIEVQTQKNYSGVPMGRQGRAVYLGDPSQLAVTS